MQLYTLHKILIFFAILLSAAVVAWSLHHFISQGNIRGALLAGVGTVSGIGFGYYLRLFINRNK